MAVLTCDHVKTCTLKSHKVFNSLHNWIPDFKFGSQKLREIGPRLPFHDMSCSFIGPPVGDVVKHFIQRYNSNKVANQQSTSYDVKHNIIRLVALGLSPTTRLPDPD